MPGGTQDPHTQGSHQCPAVHLSGQPDPSPRATPPSLFIQLMKPMGQGTRTVPAPGGPSPGKARLSWGQEGPPRTWWHLGVFAWGGCDSAADEAAQSRCLLPPVLQTGRPQSGLVSPEAAVCPHVPPGVCRCPDPLLHTALEPALTSHLTFSTSLKACLQMHAHSKS